MRKGDIVKFKAVIDPGDESARMILKEDPDRDLVLVQHLVDLPIQPTSIYPVDELEVVKASSK